MFAGWYAVERTLSVHTIFTTRREAFYWLAILFTFALGTSAGDFLSEQLELGYLAALGIFAGAIVVVAILHFGLRLNAILSFWLAYILTRPLGASIGDYLASPTGEGGLGLGTNLTSVIFLSTILALVVFLAISKRDVIRSGAVAAAGNLRRGGSPAVLVVLNKVEATAALLDAVRKRRRPRARRASSSSCRTPTTSPSIATVPTPATARRCLRGRCPSSQAPAGTTGRRPGRQQPQRLRRHRRRAGGEAPTGRSSSRPRRAHISHWLHFDLPQRVAELGYPMEAIAAAA